MLQEVIPSPPRNAIHACPNELCDHCCVAILPVQTDQSHFWWESKVLQVRRDGVACRAELLTIVAIAAPCVGADPIFACASLRAVVRVRTTSPRLRPR